MILQRLHPRRLGFIGGFLFGFLIALFAFGDLAHFLAFVHPDPAFAQTASAPAVRIMDGAHVQLATVSHTGRLLVDTGSTSGLTDHITSVTHVSGAVMIRNTAGTVATLTGTALDVNCTGCSAASVVSVDHVSGALHLAGSISGARLHIQGVGTPGQSHGGVLTIQGITGMNAVAVGQSGEWNIRHLSSVAHIAGTMRLMSGTPNNQLAIITHFGALAVTCYTAAGATESCGGTAGSGDAVNVFHQSTIRHISSVTHVGGTVSLVGRDGTYVALTGTDLNVNCTGCSSSATVHISAALHVAGTINGARFHIQGVGSPGQSHGGVLTIQGIAGANAVTVSQSTALWNIQHISSAIHLAGGVTDNANSALRVTGVTVFSVMGAIDHIAGSLHIAGTINGAQLHIQGLGTPGASHGGVLTVQGITGMNAFSISQSTARWNVDHVTSQVHVAGAIMIRDKLCISCVARVDHTGALVTSATVTVTTDNVNVFHQSTVRHISSEVHVAGSLMIRDKLCLSCVARVDHTGALVTSATVTVTTDNVNVFHQSTVRHVSSVTHIAGAVSLVNQAGTYATFTGTTLDVTCSGCAAASVVAISHISSALHSAGTIKGAQFHITGLGTPGQTHGGVFTIQGVTGMIAVDVTQSVTPWTVAHVSSVTHMAIMSVAGTALGLGQGLPIGHITSVVHIAVASHAVLRVMGAHVTGSIHVAGLTNVGSGAPNTGTTQMVCHSTLAIHVAAAAPGYTQIIHLTSSNGGIKQAQWRIYICSIMVVSAHAQGFSLLEGTGTTCQGQVRHAVIGSWRPEDSVVLAASGGFSVVAPFPVLSTQVPGNNLCIGQTSRTTGTISGFMSYRAGP